GATPVARRGAGPRVRRLPPGGARARPARERMTGSRAVLTVSQVTDELRAVLEERFPAVWVEGEISNFRAYGSGHAYFTLKGAALRDMLRVIGRRFGELYIVIAPCRVQGEGAAEEVAQGLRDLDALGDVDVVIVGRGGGSLEDLWVFNEEAVARAIAASKAPV